MGLNARGDSGFGCSIAPMTSLHHQVVLHLDHTKFNDKWVKCNAVRMVTTLPGQSKRYGFSSWNMVYHAEFKKAGEKPGLQVWRIEKMDLMPVPENLHGSFYTGDTYIILNTIKQHLGSLQYDLHFWHGETMSKIMQVIFYALLFGML